MASDYLGFEAGLVSGYQGDVEKVEDEMSISVKRYSEKHHELGRQHGRVLFMWEMDKRYVPEDNDQVKINVIGTMSREKCRRIWEIMQEPDPIPANIK